MQPIPTLGVHIPLSQEPYQGHRGSQGNSVPQRDMAAMESILKEYPHLRSPAHLAIADSQGKWKPVPHLRAINRALVHAWRTPNSRTAINVPFQMGKSMISSIYFPTWVLLLWPMTRLALASYEETFAINKFGGPVRDLVKRYGPAIGVHVKDDSSAKGEWEIDGYGGGMVCKGRGGALQGRPADLLILDDLIKSAEEALSPTILEGIWDWYQTVAYSRLGPTAPIVSVGTRWVPKDWFGRVIEEMNQGGEKYNFIIFKAIATKDDSLGRSEGEALFPTRVPLERLQKIQKARPRWFKACWQQDPEEAIGLHFQPKTWPHYHDVGDAWRIRIGNRDESGTITGMANSYNSRWHSYRKVDCQIIVALDWAQKGSKDSDKTAFVVAALTADGLMLVLEVFNDRLRYEQNGPMLADYCRRWNPHSSTNVHGSLNADGQLGNPLIVAGDDDMLSDAMVVECRRYRDIPEIRRMPIRMGGGRAKSKLIRAQAGIIRSQNGLFLLPEQQAPWYTDMVDQLAGFTGIEGAEDDIADCFGILGRLVDEFKPGADATPYDSTMGRANDGYQDGVLYGSPGYPNRGYGGRGTDDNSEVFGRGI